MATLLRRSWALILIGTLAGLAVGAFVFSTLAKQYTASASVSVTPTGVSDATVANSRTGTNVNLDTEAQVVTSNSVVTNVQAIDRSAKSLSVHDLTKPITIAVPANSSILTISYTATSARLAQIRANAFATAYLRSRAATADAVLKAQSAKAQSALTSLNRQYKSVSATIDKLPKGSSQLTVLRTQRGLLLDQIKQLTRQITGYSTTAVTPGQVLTSATAPSSPSSPSRVLWLSGGLAVGLLLGLIAAWLRASVHVRLRHRDDVARALRLPIIGAVPASSAKSALEQGVAVPEPYRRIANVLLATRNEPGVLLLTGECTTTALATITAGLAAAFASSDRQVVITSTDDGVLADQLADDLGSFGVRVSPLPTGMPAHAPLEAARQDGWLVVAGVEPGASALVQAVGAASDVVLVLVENKSKANRSARLVAQLDTVGAPLLGVILLPTARWWRRLSTRHPRAKRDARPDRAGRSAVGDARTGSQPSGARPVAGASDGVTEQLDDPTGVSARQDIARRS